MTKLPLDEASLAKLRGVKQRVEICDGEGRIVGYFEPSIYAGHVIPEFDEAELARRSKETGGYTTAEVLDYLGKLEQK